MRTGALKSLEASSMINTQSLPKPSDGATKSCAPLSSGFTQRDCDSLFAAFDFLAASGFEGALFVLLHDLMNLALALGT